MQDKWYFAGLLENLDKSRPKNLQSYLFTVLASLHKKQDSQKWTDYRGWTKLVNSRPTKAEWGTMWRTAALELLPQVKRGNNFITKSLVQNSRINWNATLYRIGGQVKVGMRQRKKSWLKYNRKKNYSDGRDKRWRLYSGIQIDKLDLKYFEKPRSIGGYDEGRYGPSGQNWTVALIYFGKPRFILDNNNISSYYCYSVL
jgi:hypothetical protein